MNISLICFTRAGFETMKRINNALSGASEALTDEVCPEQYDKSAEAEDRPCGGDTLYKSLWIAGRYALQLAAADAGVPYQAVSADATASVNCQLSIVPKVFLYTQKSVPLVCW